jgi:hypothetical protein
MCLITELPGRRRRNTNRKLQRNASRFRRSRERAVGNPQHIKTWVRYASMRQIHAAIKHLDRGDFECAITLAAAGEEMLPPKDKPHFASCKA